VKPPRKQKPTRYGAAFYLTRRDGAVLLRRRADKGLLGGMLEVPGTEWLEKRRGAPALKREAPVAAEFISVKGAESDVVTHTFTHFHLELLVFSGSIDARRVRGDEWVWAQPDELADIGLPTVFAKVVGLVSASK